MKLNWNFQRGGGGGGHRANPFCEGVYMDIFWNHTIDKMKEVFVNKSEFSTMCISEFLKY